MFLCFSLNVLCRFLKSKPPYKKTGRLDPEGGHMFIEEFILAYFPTPKVVVCDIYHTYDHLRGRFVGNIDC